MILQCITTPNKENSYVASTKIRRLVQSPSVKDGIISSSSVYEDYDFSEALKDFVSSDFDIANILSIGSNDMLKPTFVSTLSSMDFADKFQNITFKEKSDEVA